MIIGNNCGHTISGFGSGAIGLLQESICSRQIGNHFEKLLINNKHKVIDCTIDYSSNYLKEATERANRQKLDYAITHHLNHSNDVKANGVEVWIYDLNDRKTYEAAARICSELSKLGFKNRGVKENKKFAWLKNTKSKAMIIEYFFCSNKSDVEKYNPQKLALASYNGLTGAKDHVNSDLKEPTKYKYENGDYNRFGIVVNTNNLGLNIRAERNSKSKAIGKLVEGSKIKLDYCMDNWFSVWENGECGFICGEYIKLL